MAQLPRSSSLASLVSAAPRLLAIASPLALAAATMLGSGAAHAATFSVTTTADAGPGSLRNAIAQANATPGADIVDIAVGGPITLTSGDITISDSLLIDGNGAAIDASGNGDRIFTTTAAGDLEIIGLTLSNATGLTLNGACIRSRAPLRLEQVVLDSCQTTGNGGAVHHRNADLDLDGVTIVNSSANRGGGLHVNGAATVSISDSAFDGNTAVTNGGHMFIGATTSIADLRTSTLVVGTASRGGAIFTEADNTWLTDCDLSSNTASARGGAIAQRRADSFVALYDSYAAGNSATRGGVLHSSGNNRAYLSNVELLGNTASAYGGAISGTDLLLSMYDSLISGNQAQTRDGGGIHLEGESRVDGVANAVTANSAGRDGGGIFADMVKGPNVTSARVFLLNLTAHSNSAGRDGGGLWIESTLPTYDIFSLRSSTVANNTAGQSFGGVFVNLDTPGSGSVDWSGNAFDGNTAAGAPDDCAMAATSAPITWIDNLMFEPNNCSATISGQSALLPAAPAAADRCLVPGAGSPLVDANNFPFAPTDDILHTPRSSPGDIGSCEQ